MNNDKITKRQQEREAMLREQASRSFVNASERLLLWSAFKDFILNDFYQYILSFAESKEDQGETDDFGFSIVLSNTEICHRHKALSEYDTGLPGLYNLLVWATDWLNDEIETHGGNPVSETEIPEMLSDISVANEMDIGYIRGALSDFADSCETVGRTENLWVNIYFAFHPSCEDIPETLDASEAASIRQPNSMQELFQRITTDTY